MYKSLEKQIAVLGLLRQGKKPSEIRRQMNVPISTVGYIRKQGPININRLIVLLQMAIANGVLETDQTRELKAALGKS